MYEIYFHNNIHLESFSKMLSSHFILAIAGNKSSWRPLRGQADVSMTMGVKFHKAFQVINL